MKKGWDIVFSLFIQLWITRESHGQDRFCPESVKDETVNICTNHSMSMTDFVYIDTVSVPMFQQSFCECVIAPFHPGTYIGVRIRTGKDVQFKINNIVIDETSTYGRTNLQGETTLYFSTAKNHTTGACALVGSLNGRFNITCMHPATLVTDTTASVTSRAITTEISKDNITKSVAKATSVKTADITTEASRKRNITTLAQSRSNGLDSSTDITVIVVPVVVGVLLILAVAVLLLVYVRRRRIAKDTKIQEQEPGMPVSEQGQGQQNNSESEESNINISVNAYERLNMYENDMLAGEMYQQLNADKTEEYQEMSDVVTDSRNQNRNVTKQVNLQDTDKGPTHSKERLRGQAKGQGNNSNGEDRDIEIPSNAYEQLNMYVNNNLAGEMYEQLDTNQGGDYRGKHVPGKEDRPVNKSDHRTKSNKQAFAVYANAK
ncbi:uncharacterized protein LOC123552540 isoform X2 [Mercenaria mercenaria]|uniref:uncharacterized protein LOC123552540 isoform X2 n=1 Tax=Mercenaria mercenaria TaxID=6596 RepID=UPI00234F8090|nr:uncharacterized protein LOC123552540 isoform X2 [Mercenaria mercenaria]